MALQKAKDMAGLPVQLRGNDESPAGLQMTSND